LGEAHPTFPFANTKMKTVQLLSPNDEFNRFIEIDAFETVAHLETRLGIYQDSKWVYAGKFIPRDAIIHSILKNVGLCKFVIL
jgi:hypothetical protein